MPSQDYLTYKAPRTMHVVQEKLIVQAKVFENILRRTSINITCC